MLSKILKKSTCAKCRFCCVFRQESQWETPIFFENTAKKLLRQFPDARFKKVSSKGYTMDLSDLYDNKPVDYEAPCYFLSSDKGCMLSDEDKPFDCKIWPFMLMKGENSELYLVLDPVCDAVNKYSLESLQDFAVNENLHRLIFDYEFKHPVLVESFHRDFPVLHEYSEQMAKAMSDKLKSLKEFC